MSRKWSMVFALLVVLGGGLLCSACAPDIEPVEEEMVQETTPAEPGLEPEFPASQIRSQWAQEAEASSEYVVPEWGAEQATGPPDAPGCGDYPFAWASAASDSVEALTLTYETPVYAYEIEVIQSFNPDQVVKIEVQDQNDQFQVVYESQPRQIDRPCPYALTVSFPVLDYKTNTIRITVDQSVLGLGWNEIDAVQLVGVDERPGDN